MARWWNLPYFDWMADLGGEVSRFLGDCGSVSVPLAMGPLGRGGGEGKVGGRDGTEGYREGGGRWE